jgi:hypothetical protein
MPDPFGDQAQNVAGIQRQIFDLVQFERLGNESPDRMRASGLGKGFRA